VIEVADNACGDAHDGGHQPPVCKESPMTDVDVSRTDLDGFTGAVIRPQDAGYPAARRVWKGMIDRYPSMIVRPESSDDVAIAVTFARDRGLPLAIRGGGHNVAGSGVCDRGVVIDLRELRGVAVDPVARTVTGGVGAPGVSSTPPPPSTGWPPPGA